MSQDKKLRLVPPPPEAARTPRPSAEAEEPPPSAEEIAAAEALRRAIDAEDEPLSDALRAANAPAPLSEPDHDAILARALGDPLAAPTRVERRDADRLVAELAGTIEGEGSEAYRMARALRAAHTPRALDQLTHERILKKALGAGATERQASVARRGSRIAVVSGLFAAAAALAMFFTTQRSADRAPASVAQAPAATYAASPSAAAAATAAAADDGARHAEAAPGGAAARVARGEQQRAKKGSAEPKPAAAPGKQAAAHATASPWAEAPAGQPSRPAAARPADVDAFAAFIPSRSTDELFDPAAKFPRTGGESARIDRIAMARESDLRKNRYAAWGVP